jgi:hypothetical protein
MLQLISSLALLGFFVAGLAYWYLLSKVIDGRRGQQVSALRLLISPFFLDREALTEAGRRHYDLLVRVWLLALGCWATLLVLRLL